jgi:Tetratricopeptide repeat
VDNQGDDEAFGWGWWRRPAWFEWLMTKWYHRFLYRLMLSPENPEGFDKLIVLQERILANAIRRFGPDGGPTANVRHHLANTLERSGRLDEARVLHEEVLAANRRHRDPEDPNVLAAEEHLAVNLFHSGMLDEARPLFTHVRDARERKLGSDDPTTQRPGKWLAAMGRRGDRG